jgi:predicted transcriptional regulator
MTAKDKAREERLAAALRENLRKRKAQTRAVEQGVTPAKAGVSGQESETKE